jgi:hypothetical protein
MPLPDDIRHYLKELHQAAAGQLTLERIERLLAAAEHLAGLLTQARSLVQGGSPLLGDLWPERDDEDTDDDTDEEEGHTMAVDRGQLLMLLRVIKDAGVRPEAEEDALWRLEQAFEGQDLDAVTARSHLDGVVRQSAPHLWGQPQAPAAAPATVYGAGPEKRRRPGQYTLTPAEKAESDKIPKLEDKLTYFRECRDKHEAEQQR